MRIGAQGRIVDPDGNVGLISHRVFWSGIYRGLVPAVGRHFLQSVVSPRDEVCSCYENLAVG